MVRSPKDPPAYTGGNSATLAHVALVALVAGAILLLGWQGQYGYSRSKQSSRFQSGRFDTQIHLFLDDLGLREVILTVNGTAINE